MAFTGVSISARGSGALDVQCVALAQQPMTGVFQATSTEAFSGPSELYKLRPRHKNLAQILVQVKNIAADTCVRYT